MTSSVQRDREIIDFDFISKKDYFGYEKVLTTLKEFQNRYGCEDQQIEQLVSKELPSRIATAEKSGIRNRLKNTDCDDAERYPRLMAS